MVDYKSMIATASLEMTSSSPSFEETRKLTTQIEGMDFLTAFDSQMLLASGHFEVTQCRNHEKLKDWANDVHHPVRMPGHFVS